MSESQKRRDERAPAHEKGASSSASKPLKSSEPDLVIVCRYEGKEETLQYHSVAMAIHSSYFDTLLASGMQESVTKTVTLEDVDPDTFQKAVEILEDPVKSSSVTAQDIIEAAAIYNRFEFSSGLKLVEAVLVKFLEEWTKQKEKSPTVSEKKLIGDSILFAQEANLENLTQKSISFIKEKLKYGDNGMCLAIFDQSFIETIARFLEEHRAACLTDFFSRHDPDGLQETLQAADLLVNLYWKIFTTLALMQLGPFGIAVEGRLTFGREERAPEVVNFRPYGSTTTAHRDGRRIIEATLGRICSDADWVLFCNKGEVGDWAVSIDGVRDGVLLRFVCPSSKTFPLPPGGHKFTLAWEGDEDESEPDVTFEIVSMSIE